MAPPPKYEVKRIPSVPHPGPPPTPQYRRLSANSLLHNEDAARKDYDTYDFMQTIRIEELSTPLAEEFTATGEVYRRPDGQRMWRVVKQPESTLKPHALFLRGCAHHHHAPDFLSHVGPDLELRFPLRRPAKAG